MSIIAKDKFDVMVAMTGEEQPQFTGGDARSGWASKGKGKKIIQICIRIQRTPTLPPPAYLKK